MHRNYYIGKRSVVFLILLCVLQILPLSYGDAAADGGNTETKKEQVQKAPPISSILIPIAEIVYKDDFIDGAYKEYYQDGNPKEISMYSKGKKNGTENLFYPNGKRMSIGQYKNGIRDGLWKYFHNNGKRKSEGHYKNGVKSGKWKIFDENEKLSNTEEF